VAHSATISIGVATADEKMDGLSDLMKMADETLYAAALIAVKEQLWYGVSNAISQ
jgi:hypothetical protein